MVDPGLGLHAEPAAREPQPQRQVDVLVIQEEVLGEPSGPLEASPRNGETRARDEAGLPDRPLGSGALSRAARPGDAGEVNGAAASVHDPTAPGRHQPLPGRPAAAVGQWPLDRLAEARSRDGIRVQEQEQLAGGGLRSTVTAGAEAQVGSGLDQLRLGASSRIAAGVPSVDPLSTTMSWSRSRSWAPTAGSASCTAAR